MKVNDLMIADLIMSYDVPLRVIGLSMKAKRYDPIYVGKVNCEDMKELGDEYWTTEDELFGIHLTSEILEKNGWKHHYQKDELYECDFWTFDNGIHIELNVGKNCLTIWQDYEKNNDGIYADYLLPNPSSVHQLQHALRLCGLNEMADNIQI